MAKFSLFYFDEKTPFVLNIIRIASWKSCLNHVDFIVVYNYGIKRAENKTENNVWYKC